MGWPAQMRGVADQQLVVSLSGRTNRTAGCPARTLTMHLVPRARAVPIFRRPGRGRRGRVSRAAVMRSGSTSKALTPR
jgi:hypothetical protein